MKEIKITVNGKKYEVKVGDVSASPVEVVVDGKSYQVEYDAPSTGSAPVRTAPVVSAPSIASPVVSAAAPAPVAASGSGVRSPMPGTIVKIDVKPGDKVTRGQQLVSLEAMKMKNSIKSPVDAVIKAVHVSDGQKVQFNDMLVSFE
jgi:glutaconyl-CoA/methylmalonyl-CoA decarboxylase subunit gamma